MSNSLTLKVLLFTLLQKHNWRTFHPFTGIIFMHQTYNKCFLKEDSSVLFNQDKCAMIHRPRHSKKASQEPSQKGSFLNLLHSTTITQRN